MTRKMVSLQDLELAIKARRMEVDQVAADCGLSWSITQFENEDWLEEDPYTLEGKQSGMAHVHGEHRVQAASHIVDNDPERVMKQCSGDLAMVEYARARFDALAKLDPHDAESVVLHRVCVSLAVMMRMIGLNYFTDSTVDVGLRGM